MKMTFKKVLFAIVMTLICSFEPAEGATLCDDIGFLAEGIMKARQNDVPALKLIQVANNKVIPDQLQKVYLELVRFAWQFKIEESFFDRELSIDTFSTVARDTCRNPY